MKLESNESTNVWDYKPTWCQPWSIILTGISLIFASWLILHNVWLTLAVSLAMFVWWIYFLVVYPKAFAEYITAQQTMANLDS